MNQWNKTPIKSKFSKTKYKNPSQMRIFSQPLTKNKTYIGKGFIKTVSALIEFKLF